MRAMDFDSGRMEIACNHCGSRFKETFGRVASGVSLPCPSCAKPIDRAICGIDTALANAREAFRDLQRAMQNLRRG